MSESEVNNKYMNADQAWVYLGLKSKKALYSKNSRRELPFIKNGRSVFYDKAVLDSFMAAHAMPVINAKD